MWGQVQKLLYSEPEPEKHRAPPVVPLRRSALALNDLKPGATVRFAIDCPLPPLTGQRVNVIATRQYRFGDDTVKSHVLDTGTGARYALTIAEDSQGHYLGLSRALDAGEQDAWFGRDALSFFTEPSSARTIRCKADLMIEGGWAASRYSKSVDWVEGSLNEGSKPFAIRYNLLVDESGEKALEIEHHDESGHNRVYVTVYRPVSDIAAIESGKSSAVVQEMPSPAPVATKPDHNTPEPPLFREPPLTAPQPKARLDFRRIGDEGTEIHIPRLTRPEPAPELDMDMPELPAFLTRNGEDYLSLDEVIPPEGERVRVSLHAARALIDAALDRKARVRDILRDMVGLDSALSEEVIFELPLSDSDYRTLAMRYRLRPDHRDEIRAKLQEELREKLAIKS